MVIGGRIFSVVRASQTGVAATRATRLNQTDRVKTAYERTIDPTDVSMNRWLNRDWSALQWRFDRVVRRSSNPTVFANALAGAKTAEERALVYRSAVGDVNAYLALRDARPSVAEAIANADGLLDANRTLVGAVAASAPPHLAGDIENMGNELHLSTLADEHRATVMAGRTLTQHAVPITFGLKAATWLQGLVDAADDVDRASSTATTSRSPSGS